MSTTTIATRLAPLVLAAALFAQHGARAGEGSTYDIEKYQGGIYISGSAGFRQEIRRDLDLLVARGYGGILDRISDSGQLVDITETHLSDFTAAQPTSAAFGTVPGPDGTPVAIPGVPGDAIIGINLEQLGDDPGDTCIDTSLALLHELNHASNATTGSVLEDPYSSTFPYTGDSQNSNFTNQDEANAVGVGDYANNPYSENSYRNATGKDERHDYSSVCTPADPGAVGTGEQAPETPPAVDDPTGPPAVVDRSLPGVDPSFGDPLATAVETVPSGDFPGPSGDLGGGFDGGYGDVFGSDFGSDFGLDYSGGSGGGGGGALLSKGQVTASEE